MSTVAAYHHPIIEFLGHSSTSSLEEVGQITRKESAHFVLPVTWQRKDEAIDALIDTFRKHRDPNWDGYDAEPIKEAACAESAKFLRKLPSAIPNPEIVAEPDGDIALEWYVRKRLLFVVSFSGKGVISYAGMFGRGSKAHGTEYFSDSIPSSVIANIRRLLSQA